MDRWRRNRRFVSESLSARPAPARHRFTVPPPPPAEAGTALAQPQCHSGMETQGSQGKDFSSHRFIRGCRCLHPFSFILYAFVHPFNSIYCALTLSQAPFWDEDATGTSLTRLTGMGPAMGLL